MKGSEQRANSGEGGRMTIEEIKKRIEEAVYVMKLLPPVKVRGYLQFWPKMIYSEEELALMEAKPLKITPTGKQISRMDEVLGWMEILEPWERELVWQRGARIPWKIITNDFGYSRAYLSAKYDAAISKMLIFTGFK